MTVKAGQKCTAIRRAMAPAEHLDAVQEALIERLGKVQDRRPARGGRRRWARSPAASQLDAVREAVAELSKSARIVSGDPDALAGRGQRRLHLADPAALRRSLGRRPRSTTSRRSGRSRRSCPIATSTTPSRSPIAAWAASRCRCSPIDPTVARGIRARRRRLSRPDGDPRPHQREGIDRPRLAPPRPRPWRPRPRRRRRGDGRHPRRHALHAAHRAPGLARRCCRAIVEQWLPGAPKPSGDVHPFRKRISELEIGYTLKTASRTVTLDDIEHFAAFHRRQFLRPYGRGGGEGEPDLRRPGRPRLSDPELRRRPVRRSRSGPGARQYRPREPALPDPALSGRFDAGGADRQVEERPQRGDGRGALGGRTSSTRRTRWSRPTTC